MEWGYKQCILTLLYGLIWIIAVTSGATTELEHEVEMKLYQASVSDWENNGRNKFAVIVAGEAQTYCDGNPEACTVNDIGPEARFTRDNYDGTSAAKEKAYLVVKFSLTLPGHDDDDDVYLNKDALEVVTVNSAKKLREQTDLTIVLVEGEPQPLAPNNTLNIAICVTAIVVLIIMIITLCVMQQKCGGHDHELLAQKEEAANNRGNDETKAARGGTVATLQSVVTEDQLPPKKEQSDVKTTDM